MKALLLGLLFFGYNDFSLFAQQAKIIEVKPGIRVIDALNGEDVYGYPQFAPGTVAYKNGKSTAALLNYHVFYDEMQTIRENDTVVLNKSEISFVTIKNDTFGREQFFYKLVRDYDKMRLVSRKVFAMVSRLPIPEDTSRYKLQYSVLNSGRFLKDITPVDTFRLAVFEMFYIANVQNVLLPVHRNTLIDLYPHKRKALLEYLRQRTVNIYDKEAVLALLNFVAQKHYTH